MGTVGIRDFTAIADYTHPIIPVKDRDWMILRPLSVSDVNFCSELLFR